MCFDIGPRTHSYIDAYDTSCSELHIFLISETITLAFRNSSHSSSDQQGLFEGVMKANQQSNCANKAIVQRTPCHLLKCFHLWVCWYMWHPHTAVQPRILLSGLSADWKAQKYEQWYSRALRIDVMQVTQGLLACLNEHILLSSSAASCINHKFDVLDLPNLLNNPI